MLVSKITADESEEDWTLNKFITNSFTTPLAAVGVVLNCLVLLGWRKCPYSFALLFKALAVADIVFAIGFCVFYHSPHESTVKIIFLWIGFTGSGLVVNITLLMSCIRWAAVVLPNPSRVRKYDFIMRVALCIMVVYCAITRLLLDLNKHHSPFSKGVRLVVEVTINMVVLVLPVLVQAALSVHLLWLMSRVNQNLSNKAELADETTITKRSNRQLTAVVVTITLVTFLIYPVGVSVASYVKLASSPLKRSVFACVNLLFIFNSSVNFFIYWFFMSDFRMFLKHQLLCCAANHPETNSSLDARQWPPVPKESTQLHLMSSSFMFPSRSDNLVNEAQVINSTQGTSGLDPTWHASASALHSIGSGDADGCSLSTQTNLALALTSDLAPSKPRPLAPTEPRTMDKGKSSSVDPESFMTEFSLKSRQMVTTDLIP